MKIGICIPESCTAENLEISLQHQLNDVFIPHQVQAKVNVEPMLCSTDKPMFSYDIGYYVTMYVSDFKIMVI